MFKKTTIFICALLCIGFALPVSAQLDLSPPPMVTGDPGDTVVIPLNLTNPGSDLIDAFGLTFLYPSNLLAFDTTDASGTLVDGWIVAGGQENILGEIIIGAFDTTGTTSSGALINVVFIIKDGVSGSGNLQLQDFGDDLVGATTTDGEFAVSSGLVGDIDGDGNINSFDAFIVLACEANLPGIPEEFLQRCIDCGDSDGDGNVNSFDAFIILAFEANLPGIPPEFPIGEPCTP